MSLDIPWLTNALGVVFILPIMVFLATPLVWETLVESVQQYPAKTLLSYVNAVCSIAAGGSLLALCPIAIPAFAATLAISLLRNGAFSAPLVQTVGRGVFIALALAYAVWLKRRGALRSKSAARPT